MPEGNRHEPKRLPPGRHGLSRNFVVSNQRQRILAAVADVVSERGYASTSVAHICEGAGVSRRTFYEFYDDKESAFLASYDEVAVQILGRVTAAYEGATGMLAQARDALEAFLGFIASEPAFADMCIVEVMSAGAAAVERRNAAMRGFTALIQRAVEEDVPEGDRPPELVAETIVGGIYEVVFARVLDDRTAELPDLLPDLLYALLQPYLGTDIAAAAMRDVRETRERKTRTA